MSKAPPSLTSAANGKRFYVSPTAIEAFERCRRAWWLARVARVPTRQSPAAATGSAVHRALEDHLEGTPGRQKYGAAHLAMLQPAIDRGLLPEPGSVAVETPLHVLDLDGTGLAFNGKADFAALDGGASWHPSATPYWIGDLKTSGNPERWHKTPTGLVDPHGDGLQMLSYAFAMYHDLQGGPPAEVGVSHVYCATKGAPRAFPVHGLAPWAAVRAAWDGRVLPAARAMATYADTLDDDDVEPSPGEGCRAYGGCPFADLGCVEGRAYLDGGGRGRASLLGLGRATPTSPAPPASTGDRPMDALQALLLGKTAPAPAAPAPAAPAAPAPAAPAAPAPAAPAAPLSPLDAALLADDNDLGSVLPDPPELRAPPRTLDNGGAVNPIDASPTDTPTRAQVLEAAELVQIADEAFGEVCDDAHIERLLLRQGLPIDCLTAVKAAAREGGDGTPPRGSGPAGASPPPTMQKVKSGADNSVAAEAIRDAVAAEGHLSGERVADIVGTALSQRRPRKKRIRACLKIGVDRGWFAAAMGPTTAAPTEAPAVEAPAVEAPAVEAPAVEAPTEATSAPAVEAPTAATSAPTEAPTAATSAPTEAPTEATSAPTAATSAPAVEAPTEAPSPAALPHGVAVFVGCMPVGAPIDLDLAALVAPLGRVVAAEHVGRDGRPAPVVSWQLIPFRGGAQAIAARLDAYLGGIVRPADADPWAGLGWRRLFVDPSHPAAPECLAVLGMYPGVVVVRAVGR